MGVFVGIKVGAEVMVGVGGLAVVASADEVSSSFGGALLQADATTTRPIMANKSNFGADDSMPEYYAVIKTCTMPR